MLFTFAIIFILGIFLSQLFEKFKLPGLLAMIFIGMALQGAGLIDNTVMSISPDLRKIALVIILIRAGLALDIKPLLKIGKSAFLMCFVPAVFEIAAITFIAPMLFGLSYIESAVLGSVIAAVSPAVIVPRMLKLTNEKYGTAKQIPQLIMAGASVDDVFVIVLFTTFSALAATGVMSYSGFIKIPVSIVLGVLSGIAFGKVIAIIYKKVPLSTAKQLILFLSFSFLLVSVENVLNDIIGFSGLLGIMAMGATLKSTDKHTSYNLSSSFADLWAGAEILLFVLVGATVNVQYALSSLGLSIILLAFSLTIRIIGVILSLNDSGYTFKEKLFCAIAYTPKATVQAAIGSVPLAMGLACGETVLSVAVVAILITAPLGAFFIDNTYTKLLDKE